MVTMNNVQHPFYRPPGPYKLIFNCPTVWHGTLTQFNQATFNQATPEQRVADVVEGAAPTLLLQATETATRESPIENLIGRVGAVPQTQSTEELIGRVERAARKQLQEIEGEHSSPWTNKCIEKVIPMSDQLAIHRNIFKLSITLLGLTLSMLALAGVSPPLALAGIAAAISLAGLAILFGLYKTGKISPKDAWILAAMITALPGALFLGGSTAHAIAAGIYAISVIIQGGLFAIPQGTLGWGKDGYNTYRIAKEVGDETHMTSGKCGMIAGSMSAVEGTTWIFMGVLLLCEAMGAFLPGIPSETLAWVTTLLFLGIFNIGYTSMIVTGMRDFKMRKTFLEKFNQAIPEQAIPEQAIPEQAIPEQAVQENKLKIIRCKNFLTFFKEQLLCEKSASNQDSVTPDQSQSHSESTCEASANITDQQQLMKKAFQLKKLMDSEEFDFLTIEHIKSLLKDLENKQTIQKIESLIDLTRASIKRKVNISLSQIKIGLAGLCIGSVLSLLSEFTNQGSLIHMPYLGDVAPQLSQTTLDAVSSSVTIADCSFWAFINYLFKKCLDAPEGRTEEQETRWNEIKETFFSKWDPRELPQSLSSSDLNTSLLDFPVTEAIASA